MPGNAGMVTPLYTSSNIINGQLVPQTRGQNYYPLAVGPVLQGVPASPPQTAGTTGVGGGPGADQAVGNAQENPWSPVHSPVPWMIGMFILGYVLLRYVHWGY